MPPRGPVLSSLPLAPVAGRLLDGLQRGSRLLLPPPGGAAAPATAGLPASLGRLGRLEVRLATTAREVRWAQRLRYRVFYEEMSAIPDMMSRLQRRDMDGYDAFCDHLLVIDHDAPPRMVLTRRGPRPVPAVVGTYRLLRQERADAAGGFYSAAEFDIDPMLSANPHRRFMELGRSCVLPGYRDKRTVELLWQGIWTYVRHHRVDVMFGCASLEGTNPAAHVEALSFLHHHAAAPDLWRVSALPSRRAPVDLLPVGAVDSRRTLHGLPPLLKGYLRLGARIGEGAVVDHQFGTTDVLVVLPTEFIPARYLGHFGSEAA
ncbi:l-ornithine N(alpha)-acyltransferase [Alsobacter sp. R-9]